LPVQQLHVSGNSFVKASKDVLGFTKDLIWAFHGISLKGEKTSALIRTSNLLAQDVNAALGGTMNVRFLVLIPAILLSFSVTIADERRPSSELSAVGLTQFTQPALGLANDGAVPTMQSSKISFGGSLEYRHWFGNNGIAATYSVVASDANFWSPSATWQMSLTRHEGTLSYVRRFIPHSRLNPYISLGAGGFVTHGGIGWRLNGTWIPHDYLGVDGQFEMRGSAGFDLWRTKHLGVRTSYVVHWFRAPNFSDASYHAPRTFIFEPQIGFTWAF
jgi:hypothetical protein